ncbi:MAG: hypothetical protein PGN08_16275 [Sphingomonas taxi]
MAGVIGASGTALPRAVHALRRAQSSRRPTGQGDINWWFTVEDHERRLTAPADQVMDLLAPYPSQVMQVQ